MDSEMQPHILNPEEFRTLGYRMIDFIVDYHKNIESYPVRSTVQPGYLKPLLPDNAPDEPEDLETILKDVSTKILPGITHWQSPNFHAYFPSNFSVPSFLGDMLSASLNVVGFSWICSPAATELETIALDWFGNLLNLPPQFNFSASGGIGGGSIQGSASESVLVSMLAAKSKVLTKLSQSGMANGEAIDKLVVYASDQAHSSIQKACKIAGVLEHNVRVLPTNASSAYSLLPHTLKNAITEDEEKGLIPFFLNATMGTTSSTALDSISELGDIALEHDLWMHVDAAYAGSALVCSEYHHHIHGVEKVNSICINAHKWFLTNFPCSCLWVQNFKLLGNALSTNAEFLKNKASETQSVVDFKDFQIPLGRSFRSLKLWMVMRMYGKQKLQNYIRHQINLSSHFENILLKDDRFEILAPRTFALVCFRLKPPKFNAHENHRHVNNVNNNDDDDDDDDDDDEHKDGGDDVNNLNRLLLEAINNTGDVFLTHTVLSGNFALRFVVANHRTEVSHVEKAWNVISRESTMLLSEYIE